MMMNNALIRSSSSDGSLFLVRIPLITIAFLLLAISLSASAVPASSSRTINYSDNDPDCPSKSSPWTVKDRSMSLYDPLTATWTFKLNLTVPRKRLDHLSYVAFRIRLSLTNGDDWAFMGNLTDRFLVTEPFERHPEDRQVYLPVTFDHSYSGNYHLSIETCHLLNSDLSDLSCPVGSASGNRRIFDLCRVKTHLTDGRLDMDRMNISISMTPNHHQGVTVEFVVDYQNSTVDFLPFREFFVELLTIKTSSDPLLLDSKEILSFKTRTKWTRVEFRNCSSNPHQCWDEELTKKAVCCFALPAGNYTSSVNPIDSRCNVRSLSDPALLLAQDLPPTVSFRTGICRRHTFNNPVEILPIQAISHEVFVTKEAYSVWIIACLVGLVLILVGAPGLFFFIMKDRQRRKAFGPIDPSPAGSGTRTSSSATHRSSSSDPNRGPPSVAGRKCRTVKVLLVYEMDPEGVYKEKAADLRRKLLESGVHKVYDYGDESQEERISIIGIHNWFMGWLYDPTVRTLVILSPGMLLAARRRSLGLLKDPNHLLLAFLMDQLLILSVTRSGARTGIFAVYFEELGDLATYSDNLWLSPFVRYGIPGHFNRLLNQLFMNSIVHYDRRSPSIHSNNNNNEPELDY